MSEIEFYQKHLDGVSRSFAFAIRQLPGQIRSWVSLSYLLARILDSVEDSPWENAKLRKSQYTEFDSFLQEAPDAKSVKQWEERFPNAIPNSEKLLLQDSHRIFKDLHNLSAAVKNKIRETLLKMSAGMQHYAQLQEKNGEFRLKSLGDVNRYCFFVAGVVGELLTKLILDDKQQMKNAFHFGLFLQKVNVLKDQKQDEEEGRFLVPDRKLILASLNENAAGALQYILSIPLEQKGYRMFCAWSFFLGGASLSWFEQNTLIKVPKLPRAMTESLLKKIEEQIDDNLALKAAFDKYFPDLSHLSLPANKSHENLDWFQKLAGGSLSLQDMQELRLV